MPYKYKKNMTDQDKTDRAAKHEFIGQNAIRVHLTKRAATTKVTLPKLKFMEKAE